MFLFSSATLCTKLSVLPHFFLREKSNIPHFFKFLYSSAALRPKIICHTRGYFVGSVRYVAMLTDRKQVTNRTIQFGICSMYSYGILRTLAYWKGNGVCWPQVVRLCPTWLPALWCSVRYIRELASSLLSHALLHSVTHRSFDRRFTGLYTYLSFFSTLGVNFFTIAQALIDFRNLSKEANSVPLVSSIAVTVGGWCVTRRSKGWHHQEIWRGTIRFIDYQSVYFASAPHPKKKCGRTDNLVYKVAELNKNMKSVAY
jgi:hypothetical protein